MNGAILTVDGIFEADANECFSLTYGMQYFLNTKN